MNKIIIEVGSTNTKIDIFDGENIRRLDELTILFKKNYKENKTINTNDESDILILAGGGHEVFARDSGIKYESNTLYNDNTATIMMDIETRKSETKRFYESISLDNIRKNVSNPDWWFATRAMCAFVLVVAEKIGAKYIVPTNISMVYGILGQNSIMSK